MTHIEFLRSFLEDEYAERECSMTDDGDIGDYVRRAQKAVNMFNYHALSHQRLLNAALAVEAYGFQADDEEGEEILIKLMEAIAGCL